MMRAALLAAGDRDVAVGAHPSFDDREHFGRRELHLAADELQAVVVYQLGAFAAMARSLGLAVIAEGVERPSQLELLAAGGCSLYQGFLLSEPVGEAALLELMARE